MQINNQESTTNQVYTLFNLHPKQCKSLFETARWDNKEDKFKPRCPYCKQNSISKHHYGKHSKAGNKSGYKCNKCDHTFNILTKTFLHGIKMGIGNIALILFMYKAHSMNYLQQTITSNNSTKDANKHNIKDKKLINLTINHISSHTKQDRRTVKKCIQLFTKAMLNKDAFALSLNLELEHLIKSNSNQ